MDSKSSLTASLGGVLCFKFLQGRGEYTPVSLILLPIERGHSTVDTNGTKYDSLMDSALVLFGPRSCYRSHCVAFG